MTEHEWHAHSEDKGFGERTGLLMRDKPYASYELRTFEDAETLADMLNAEHTARLEAERERDKLRERKLHLDAMDAFVALEFQIRELKAKAQTDAALVQLAHVFMDSLLEAKKHRDNLDYLAHELSGLLNSFEDSYKAIVHDAALKASEQVEGETPTNG